MRFRLAFALTAIPTAIGAYLAACSPPDNLEDLCGWLGDTNNCYRKFAQEVTDRCGVVVNADTPPNDPAQPSPRHGTFLKRDKLDLCVFDSAAGGRVVFDPPLDIAEFPVKTASFAIINADATLCGAGAVGNDGAFAISIESNPPIPDGGTGDAGAVDCSSELQTCGGTFSVTSITERELIDTKCPNGETHRFNRLQLAKCDGDQQIEQDYDQLMPRAEILSSAGAVGVNGFVRFRVVYPPSMIPMPTDEKYPLSGEPPVVVEYFECSVPGASSTCTNAQKDPDETDVDCGVICGKGCADTKYCAINADCASRNCAKNEPGDLVCQPNPNCKNGTHDDGEGDVDCGLICNNACGECKTCIFHDDCSSGSVCVLDTDGVKKCRADVDAGACTMPDAGGGGAGGAGGAGGSGGTP
ncbi:hypothetical protein [Polyangium sp. 15x6]|uniref:hypothetical protein n=1 Tax=Polyangium sp. 15x6 TaxID=3042687 RepID=UPI00249C2855|nr:hypothetical protein [Polyangium sp. 15x6]MDI3285682.1 hypothetical protein [Polyangium sp. 15x6]